MSSFLQWIKTHKKLCLFTLCILLLLGGFEIFRLSENRAGILTPPIKKGNIVEGVYGIGTVTANHNYNLKSGVTNIIKRIFVKEGDEVKQGDKLIDLDGVLFSAPFAGIITYLPFKVGEAAFAQSTLLTLTDLNDRYLVVSLEQQGALRVRKGQKAKLSFDTIRNESYEGFVESVYSQNDNFLARIGIANLPPQILPGMTADVAIGINQHDQALVIPVAALEAGFVYVRRHHLLKKIPVKTGIIDGVMAEILSGEISEGDQLVIRKKLGN
jgi:macrolide-specific efflux system membrane fusion protein